VSEKKMLLLLMRMPSLLLFLVVLGHMREGGDGPSEKKGDAKKGRAK